MYYTFNKKKDMILHYILNTYSRGEIQVLNTFSYII